MQPVMHQHAKINVQLDNPGPGTHEPIVPGQFKCRDNGPCLSHAKKSTYAATQRTKRNKNQPGPAQYLDARHLQNIGADMRFRSGHSVLRGNTFTTARRFHSPTWQRVRAPDAKYNLDIKWNNKEKNSLFINTGTTVFGRARTDQLKETYGLREKSSVPGPGCYNTTHSEFHNTI